MVLSLKPETDMNRHINLLSDHELDSVAGGMMANHIFDPTKAPGAYVPSGGTNTSNAPIIVGGGWAGMAMLLGAAFAAAA